MTYNAHNELIMFSILWYLNSFNHNSYKVIIGVQDDSGKTTFTLLNNDAEQLIGIPVQGIIANLGQVVLHFIRPHFVL